MGESREGTCVEAVEVAAEAASLSGELTVPADARGVVVFAHGSGSSRASPRNRAVAQALERAGFATLLFDLLSRGEQALEERGEAHRRFDISLLAERLCEATNWLQSRADLQRLPVGLFGASTGAAASLVAAARASTVSAIVSRGGRPDLAGEWLTFVRAPTLLLVGELDPLVLELNEDALTLLGGTSRLEVVPGAGHLFEEPGALSAVSDRATEWFEQHLTPTDVDARRSSRLVEGARGA